MSTVEAPTEVRAEAKWVRISPRKARLVAEHIRGRSVPEARAVLAFTSREAARAIEKVLHSAVSNAEANHGLSEDGLYIKAAYVNAGPMLKRWRPRARGRVARIHKRTCHITVLLAPTSADEAPTKSRARTNRKTTAAAPPPETSTANTEEAT
jgi:large subunit ribosomal protein L22